MWGSVQAFKLCSHTDLCDLKDGLIYRLSFRTAQDTESNPFLKNKSAKERKKERKEGRKEGKNKRRRKKKEKNCSLFLSLIHWLLKSSQAELETRVSFITGKPETFGLSQED